MDEKIITNEDVINLTTVNIDTDIFKFIDHIIQKEKDMAMKIYSEMIKQGEEPIKIIALLASKFRLMYQSVELTRSGCSQQDIIFIGSSPCLIISVYIRIAMSFSF